jgi:zinc transporter 1/2/3
MAVYVPPVDKTPPKLTLLGSGRAAVTSTGAAIMMDNVTWKAVWSDPGAAAFDAVDGDLSGAIQSFGAGAVDTSRPTSPGREFSFVVEYAVEDKSRNAAPIARRLIRVVCPSPEAYCVDPDTSAPTCTVQGVCGAPVLLSFGAASAGGGASSASTATSTAASGTTSSLVAAAAPAPPTPPAISLLVPGPVQITAGNVYDRCADNAPISAVCERGVAAEDAKDGNMERQVLVCGSR